MPVGFRIASAWVDIRAEDKGLRQQVKSAIEKAVKGQNAEIELRINTKGLRREVQDALKEATGGKKPLVEIGIKSTGLRREVSDALARATAKQKPTVKLGISSVGLRGEVERALLAATAGQDGTVRINARVDTDSLKRTLADANPTIRPEVDLTYTRAKLRAAISGLQQIADFTVHPDIDTALMQAKIRSEVAALKDKFNIQITPDVKVSEFRAKLRAAAATVSHNDIEIDFNPRINQLKLRAEAAAAAARVHQALTFNADLDMGMMALKVKAATTALNAMGRNLNFRGKVDIDTAAAMAKLARLRGEIMLMSSMLDRNGHSFGRLGMIIAASLALGPPAISALLPALKVTLTSSMELVAVFSELALVFSTVMVGANGIGNAITSYSRGAKQFAEAMSHLTPAAQKFVEAIITTKGAFHDLQSSVQETLFQGLDKSFRHMAATTVPDLTIGLGGMAAELNQMAKGTMHAVESLSRTGVLKTMFGGLQLAFKPLIPMPGQFLNMLTKMTIAGTPLLQRMTTAFGNGVDSLNDKVNKLFDSGQLQAKISGAGNTIVNFFKSIGNNPEWTKFVSDIKSNAPQMAHLLSNIAEGAMHLLNALHPVSGVLVGIIAGFAKLLNAIPTAVLTFFIAKLILLKVATKAVVWIMGLTRTLAGLKLALTAINSQAMMTGILQTSAALATLGVRGKGLAALATTIRALGKAALVLGVLFAGKEIIDHFADSASGAAPDVDKLQISLRKLSQTGNFTGELKKAFGDIRGLSEGFKTLDRGIEKNIGSWENWMGDTAVSDWTRGVIDNFKNGEKSIDGWKKKMDSLDTALTKLVEGGNGDIAAQALKRLGISAKDSKKYLGDYNKALISQKLAQSLAADAMGAYGQEALRVQTKLNLQKQAADGLKNSVEALNQAHRLAAGGEIAMEQAMDDATEALSKNGKTLNVHTQQGRDNRTALMNLAQTTSDYAIAKLEETGSYTKANAIYEQGRKQFIDLAVGAGLSTKAAKALAKQWIDMPDKAFAMKADSQQLDDAITKAQEKVDKLKQKKKTAIGADKQKLEEELIKAQAKLDGLKQKKKVGIDAEIADIEDKVKAAQDHVDKIKQKKKVAVGASRVKLDDELQIAQRHLDGLKQKKKALIEAKDGTGPGVSSAKRNIDSVHGKTVKINIQTTKTTTGSVAHEGGNYATGGMIRRATGGPIAGGFVSGPGGPTSDKIQALLSNGEYVIRASSVAKYGKGMLGALNTGRFPKFAVGGPVNGPAPAAGGTGASAGAAGATTGTFTVKDATGAPVASALNNFKLLQMGALKTYSAINANTNGFSKTLTSGVQGASSKSVGSWNVWSAGMKTKTDSAYKGVKTLTAGFSRDQLAKTTSTKNSTHNVWSSWKSGMESRTKATYGTLNAATSNFSKQSVSRIGKARDGMGSAWGGLSPKFKPPVSYLVHSVINGGVVGSMNAIMSKLGGGKKVSGISVPGFATGGHIQGPGTGTSDSIPARLSNGEFVMKASAVSKFGTGFMENINNGRIPKNGPSPTGFSMGGGVNINMGSAPGFAAGGVVGVPSADTLNKIMGDGDTAGVKKMTNFIMDNYVLPLIDSGSGGSAMKDVQRAGAQHIRGNIEKFVKDNFGGAGSAAAGLRWAKTQDGKPYQWGGNGNPSWDCSGFMSAIESVIRGEKPHRRWATGAFPPGTSGWKQGASAPFQIGITNAGVGHTAGTIGKTNVESSGGGVMVGGRARGASNGLFTSKWGYVGPNATKKASGGYISGPGGPTSDQVPAWLSNGEYVIQSAAVKRMGTGYLNAINSGQMPGFASGGSVSDTTYKIKSGDTLSGIAAKFHTTVKALMALNKTITNANKIYAGKTIVIAKGSAGSGSSGGGGSSSGGFSLGNFSKVGKSGIQSAEGTSALGGYATLSQESIAAGKKDSEVVNAFQGHDSMAELLTDLFDAESKIRAAFKGSAQTKMIAAYEKSNKAAIAYQKQLDPINVALASATEKLSALKESFDTLKTSVSSSIMEFGSITKIGKWGTNPQTIMNQLQTDVTKASAFGQQLEQLKAKGIDSALIGQIADAGITGGGAATAASLLQMSPEQVAQINALQAQLTSAADKAGTAAANGMYGAGINAAQGLVDGLKSQQKAIEDQMTIIAKAMEKAIKQALGIKSPSRVMARVGHFTADGLINAVASRKEEANATIRSLVPSSALSGTTPRIGSGTATTGTIGSGSSVTHIGAINVNVSGTFDLTKTSERRAIAQALVVEIKEEIRRDDKKRR